MDTTCLSCGCTDAERPLVQLRHKGKLLWICPRCLPVLIHKPEQLDERLAGRGGPRPPDVEPD